MAAEGNNGLCAVGAIGFSVWTIAKKEIMGITDEQVKFPAWITWSLVIAVKSDSYHA